MQLTKRNFLKSIAAAVALPLITKGNNIVEQLPQSWTAEKNLAATEDYWQQIRNNYVLKPDYVNLENGYYSIMATPVLEKYLSEIKMINREGSYYLRTVQFERKNQIKQGVAKLAGCTPEELIITRNTTESLDTIISGIDWKMGDEAIMAEQDYGSMLDMFKQQAKRYGIINKIISIPLNPGNDDEIIALYEKAITNKTRLIMVSHIINITGHILHVKKICEMAHAKGVEVMIDGAHAIAHFEFEIRNIGCDYYGSSLHKWAGAPLGAGLLYVNKDKIKNVWPIYGENNYTIDNIFKLNHTGTHPVATDIAITHALDYHYQIGIRRKEQRLRFLQNYWVDKVRIFDKVELNTPTDKSRSCAIANVGIKGMKPSDLSKNLLDKYKIWTVAIDSANVHGVRITPHLYTSTSDLDQLINALKELSRG